MDYKELENLLSNIKNVEQYTSVTLKTKKELKNIKISCFSIVFSIVKLKSLEVEYFSKCYDNGVAILLYDRLLSWPPCETWGLMSKELIGTLHFWLQAIQNQMSDSDCWWKFLRLVMKLIKDIVPKHPKSIPDKLVMLTASIFFDLATRNSLSLHQRHEVLHCLNCFCTSASQGVRLSERTKYMNYFMPLASYISSCGYMPMQLSALETLVRWLQPRTEAAVRAAAAEWFPPEMCPDSVKEHFIQANWRFFIQEARSLLYTLNNANQLVASAVVRRLTIGEKAIYGSDKHNVDELVWLDVNSGASSISVVLYPNVRDERMRFMSFETLLVDPDDTRSVLLHTVSGQIAVTVSMSQPPRLLPSGLLMGDRSDDTIVFIISSKSDLKRLDSALGAAFRDTYQSRVDLNENLQLTLSQETAMRRPEESSSEDSIFLHPKVGVKSFRRIRPAGNIVEAPRNLTNFNYSGSQSASSPATVTSEAKLQDKQTRSKTPHQRRIDEEYFKFYASRDLSVVKETNETEDYIFKHSVDIANTRQSKRKAESDTELLKQKQTTTRKSYERDELSANILFTATVGNDESINKNYFKDISKSINFNTTNFTELMIQKVYGAKPNDKLKDSGIVRSTDSDSKDKNEDCSEAIENTPTENVKIVTTKPKVIKKKPCIIVSKTTTDDESNTEAIEAYVDTRTRKTKLPYSVPKESDFTKINETNAFGTRQHEKHFSPCVGEAEKSRVKAPIFGYNKSTTNTSGSFDENCLIVDNDINLDIEHLQIIDIEIMECINDMVDRVCNVLQDRTCSAQKNEGDYSSTSKQTTTTKNNTNTQQKIAATVLKPKRNTRPISKASKEKKSKPAAKVKSNQKQLLKKMSTIIERNDEEAPKDEVDDTSIDKIKINQKSEKYTATEILTRQRVSKYKSFRKSREGFVTSSSQSILEKDSVFDNLRSTIEHNENIKLVKPKSADDIYNYNTDSEDSDFQNKQTELKKRLSAKNTVDSESCKSKQRIRRNTSKKPRKDVVKTISQARKKPATKRNYTKNKIDTEPALNDERMRDKVDEDVLNTSIIAAKLGCKEPVVTCTKLEDPPNIQEMDTITVDIEPVPNKKDSKETKPNKNNKRSLSLLKNKGTKTTSPNDDSGTTSPMPGLIVELVPSRKDDTNDLSFDVIEQNIKRICKEGRDPINDTSKTQHILFSNTEICNTPHNMPVNITDDIGVIEKENLVLPDTERIFKECELNKVTNHLLKEINSKDRHKKNKNQRNDGVISIDEVVEINDDEPENDDKSEKSMSTDGIHAHVDSDECPPSPGLLDKTITTREVNDTDEDENFICALNDSASKNRQKKDTRLMLKKSSNESPTLYPFLHNFREMVPSKRSCNSSSNGHESDIRETSETEQLKPKTSKGDKLRHQEKSSNNNTTKQHHLKQRKDDIIQRRQMTSNDGMSQISQPKRKVSLVYSVNEKLPMVSLAPLSLADIDEWTSKSSRNSNETSHIPRPHSKKADVSFIKPYNTRLQKNIQYSDTSGDDYCEDKVNDKDSDFTNKFTKTIKMAEKKRRRKLATSITSRKSNETICRLSPQSKEANIDVFTPYNTQKNTQYYFADKSDEDNNFLGNANDDIDFPNKSTKKIESAENKFGRKLATSKTSRNSNENICRLRNRSKEAKIDVIKPYNTRKKVHHYFPSLDESDNLGEDANDDDFDITKELSEKSKSTKRKTTRDDVSNSDTAQHIQKRCAIITPIDMSIFELQNKDKQLSTKRKSQSPIHHGGKRNKSKNTINESKIATVEQKNTNEPRITRGERTITKNYQKNARPTTTRNELKLSINEPNYTRIGHKIDRNEVNITQTLEKLPVPETDGVSSVYEWLQQNDSSKRGDYYTRAQVYDIVKGITEKIDTSYAQYKEISNKKNVDLFRDLKKEEVLLKQSQAAMMRLQAHQQALEAAMKTHQQALEAAIESVKIVENSIRHVKEKMSKVIRDDCAKKELIVTILKEDIQAALDHIQPTL